MKVAVLGACGLVGRQLLVLLDQDSRVRSITQVGSLQRESGVELSQTATDYLTLESLSNLEQFDCIFSALDSKVSQPWLLKNFENIQFFIDKGSAMRLREDIPLVVPELYSKDLSEQKIIASPNCTTIQFSLALAPLFEYIRHDFMVVTTLQSVSGTGSQALVELNEKSQQSQVYPFPIYDNILPQCGKFIGDTTEEELKILHESAKIFSCDLAMQVTCVRIPIQRGHHIQVTCFLKDWHHTKEDIEYLWSQSSRLKICSGASYPLSKHLNSSYDVFISRVRLNQRTLSFMVSADNLTVGAAYNAYGIFDKLCQDRQIAKSA